MKQQLPRLLQHDVPLLILILMFILILILPSNAQPSQQSLISTITPTSAPTTCSDIFLWTDALGHGCMWYEGPAGGDKENQSNQNPCVEYGHVNPNPITGLTANEACCICGGSAAGSSHRLPSAVPSMSVKPTALCQDVPLWEDEFGDTCVYYITNYGACVEFGDCCMRDGYTANTACKYFLMDSFINR